MVRPWAFTFEDQPYFAGFRQLASKGIDLPVLNVFRMYSRMGRRRVAVESSAAVPLDVILRDGVRGDPDVSSLASLDPGRLSVMVWHYHDDDVPGPEATVALTAAGLAVESGEAELTHERIDAAHSNSYTAWQRMGSPVTPNRKQCAELESAARLATLKPPSKVSVRNRTVSLKFQLPRQAVSLLVLEWK